MKAYTERITILSKSEISDVNYYLSNNPYATKSDLDPIFRFIEFIWKEQRKADIAEAYGLPAGYTTNFFRNLSYPGFSEKLKIFSPMVGGFLLQFQQKRHALEILESNLLPTGLRLTNRNRAGGAGNDMEIGYDILPA